MERGKEWHNEYEIIPHSLFTLNAFYPTEPGLGRRVVERPLASRRQDLQEAISSALSILNTQQNKNDNSKGSSKRYTANDLIEGLYRIDPIEGTEYEFWFQPSKNKGTGARLHRETTLRCTAFWQCTVVCLCSSVASLSFIVYLSYQ